MYLTYVTLTQSLSIYLTSFYRPACSDTLRLHPFSFLIANIHLFFACYTIIGAKMLEFCVIEKVRLPQFHIEPNANLKIHHRPLPTPHQHLSLSVYQLSIPLPVPSKRLIHSRKSLTICNTKSGGQDPMNCIPYQ
jgi:hypothetical protein